MIRKILLTLTVAIGLVAVFLLLNKTEENSTVNDEPVEDYKYNEKDETNDDKGSSDSSKNTNESVFEQKEIYDDHGDYDDYDEYVVDDIDEYEPYTIDDIYDKETIKKAKKLALEFIETYHESDADNWGDHIEKSKKYITNSLYSHLKDNLKNPLHYSYYKEFKEAEYHPYSLEEGELEDGEIPLVYYVQGIDKDPYGEISKETTDVYFIVVKKEDDDYVITLMTLNEPY